MAIGNIPFIISRRMEYISKSEIYDDSTKVKIMLELSKLNLEILDLYEKDKKITHGDKESMWEDDKLTKEEIDFWNDVDDPLGMREVQDSIYEKRDLKAKGII